MKKPTKATTKKLVRKRRPVLKVLKPESPTSIGYENLSGWVRGGISLKRLRSISILCGVGGDPDSRLVAGHTFQNDALSRLNTVVGTMIENVEAHARSVGRKTTYEFRAFYGYKKKAGWSFHAPSRILHVTLDFGANASPPASQTSQVGLMAHTLRMNDKVQQTMLDAQKTLVDTIETRDRQLEELGAIVETWKDNFFNEQGARRAAIDAVCTALGIPTASEQWAFLKRVEQLEARMERLKKSMEDPS